MRLGLALMLTFCALSAGMVVHADRVSAPTAFDGISINGTAVNLSTCPDRYTALNCPTTVTVAWEAKAQWYVTFECDDAESCSRSGNQITVNLSKTRNATLSLEAEYMGNENCTYCSYSIDLDAAKPKLRVAEPWVGVGKQDLLLAIAGESQNFKVVSLKSSNTGVLAVKKGDILAACQATPKKAGKSRVTLKVELNGKTRTFQNDITIKKYPNPFQSLKAAGKKVNLKKQKYACTVRGSKAKVEFKLAKGWKLLSADYYDTWQDDYVSFKSGGTVYTSGASKVKAYLRLKNKSNEEFWYKITLKE